MPLGDSGKEQFTNVLILKIDNGTDRAGRLSTYQTSSSLASVGSIAAARRPACLERVKASRPKAYQALTWLS